MPDEWKGDNPYYLMFHAGASARDDVDLDEHGWLGEHGHRFREPGEFHLVRKADDVVVLSVDLMEGEQGYYVARHIGNSGFAREVIAYGIGKKRVDGNEDNLWLLPWGQVCVGNDVAYFAIKGLRQGLV